MKNCMFWLRESLLMGVLCLSVSASAQLSGTYTVGGGGAYATIDDAATALETVGASGDVTFEIASGTYAPVTLTGYTAGYTVVFRAASGATVNLEALTGQPYAFTLNGSSDVQLEGLSLSADGGESTSAGLLFQGTCSRISVTDCDFTSLLASWVHRGISNEHLSGSKGLVTYLSVSGCTFTDISMGISLENPTTGYHSFIQISDGTFDGTSYGVRLFYAEEVIISGNTMSQTSSNEAIYLGTECRGFEVFENNISAKSGIGVSSNATPGYTNRIYNNFVVVSSTAATGAKGINIGAGEISVCHNNILVLSTSSSAYGLYVSLTGITTKTFNLQNNVVVNSGGGKAIYVGSLTYSGTSDYNCLYTSGASIGRVSGTSYSSLTNWQSATSQDAHSLNLDPGYISSSDLHISNVLLDNAGTPVGLMTDYDGDARCQTPDIGADEFTGNVLYTYYADADGDGFGHPITAIEDCTAPSGYVSDNTDCDDTNPAVSPAGTETCNGFDDDCDLLIDDSDPSVTGTSVWYADSDGDGFGNPTATVTACYTPAGYVADATDCDDTQMMVSPSAIEMCNSFDDDCDGLTDDADTDVMGTTIGYADLDNDGYGSLASGSIEACVLPAGYAAMIDDCMDFNPAIHPGVTEVCNGIDDNCNGVTDVDAASWDVFYPDNDGDGFGNAVSPTLGCTPPVGYVTDNTDCNDANAAINPAAADICADGIDSNCDGTEPACAAPLSRPADNITSTSARLRWFASCGSVRYYAQYKKVIDASWTTVNTTALNRTISGLTPGTLYQYRVRAKCANGTYSTYSTIRTFFTPIALAAETSDTEQATAADIERAATPTECWPNPSTGICHIRTTDAQLIEVFDLNGRRLQAYTPAADDTVISLDLSAQPAGTYLLRVYRAAADAPEVLRWVRL